MIKKNQKALYIFAGFLLLICAVILTIDYGSRISMPGGLMGAYPGMTGTPTNSQPTTAPSSSPNIPFVSPGAQPSIPFTPPRAQPNTPYTPPKNSEPATSDCTDDDNGNCEDSSGSYTGGCEGDDTAIEYSCEESAFGGSVCAKSKTTCGINAKCGYFEGDRLGDPGYECLCEPGFQFCPGDEYDNSFNCPTPDTEECSCNIVSLDSGKACKDHFGIFSFRTEGNKCILYECSHAGMGKSVCTPDEYFCDGENEKCQFSAYGEPECVLLRCPEGWEECYGPLGDVCFPQDYTHTCNPLYTELSAALKGEFGQRFCQTNHGTNIINFTVTRWQAGSCCGAECCTQSGQCQKDSCLIPKPLGNAFACCLCEWPPWFTFEI
jgi:hypothetical protein